jgi:WD40 repeat protein
VWLDERLRAFFDVTRDSANQPLYALRHQSLRDLFERDGDDPAGDGILQSLRDAAVRAHRSIMADLQTSVPARPAANPPDSYRYLHLATHATHAMTVDDMVQSASFLLECDPAAVSRLRAFAVSERAHAALNAWDLSAPDRRREPEHARWWLQVWARKTRCDGLADSATREGSYRIVRAFWSGDAHISLQAHEADITSLCAVPRPGEDTALASAAKDGEIRLWAHDGTPVGDPFRGHRGAVHALCAFTVGTRPLLASGGEDGTVRLWTLYGEQVGRPITAHRGEVKAVCALPTPDGDTLVASGGTDGQIRIWARDGTAVASFPEGDGMVEALCAWPTGNGDHYLVSGGMNAARVWTRDGTPVGRPLPGADWVITLCTLPLPDGRHLLVAGGHVMDYGERGVHVWDPATGEDMGYAAYEKTVTGVCAAPLPDGRYLLAAAGPHGVEFTEPTDSGYELRRPLAGSSGYQGTNAICALPMPSGRHLLATGSHRTVRLWRVLTSNAISSESRGHFGAVRGLVCVTRPGGRQLLVSCGDDASLRLWDAETAAGVGIAHRFEEWDGMTGLFALSSDRLVSVSMDGDCTLWNLKTMKQRDMLTAKENGATILAHGLGKRFLRVTDEGFVATHSASSGKRVRAFSSGVDDVTSSCVIELDGGHTGVVLGGQDGAVEIWNVVTGKRVGKPLRGHHGAVLGVCAFTSRGRRMLVSMDVDGGLLFRNPATGAVHHGAVVDQGLITLLCPLPSAAECEFLVLAGNGGHVVVWDVNSGAEVLRTPPGHRGQISDLCLIPSRTGWPRLATAGEDGTILVWDLQLPVG